MVLKRGSRPFPGMMNVSFFTLALLFPHPRPLGPCAFFERRMLTVKYPPPLRSPSPLLDRKSPPTPPLDVLLCSISAWDASDGKLVRVFKGHGHWVNTLALSSEHALRTGPFDHNGSSPKDPEEAKAQALQR